MIVLRLSWHHCWCFSITNNRSYMQETDGWFLQCGYLHRNICIVQYPSSTSPNHGMMGFFGLIYHKFHFGWHAFASFLHICSVICLKQLLHCSKSCKYSLYTRLHNYYINKLETSEQRNIHMAVLYFSPYVSLIYCSSQVRSDMGEGLNY